MSGLREKIDLWILGAISASVEGGAVSVKAFMGLAAAHAAGMQVPVLDLEQLYYVFLFAALYHFQDFVVANPIINLARPIPNAERGMRNAECGIDNSGGPG